MRPRSLPLAALLPVIAALVAAPPVRAATDDPLALVPADAVAVGVVRLAELRSNPLSARLFNDVDKGIVDGDAARFLEEANLNPKQDVDVVVVAGSPKDSEHGDGLILFQGRFEPERLAAAVVLRGGTRKSAPDGDYFLLPDKGKGDGKGDGKVKPHHAGAVAFVSPKLVMAGPEASVRKALADRAAGGTGFAKGAGIGRERSRIDRKAVIWALADSSRLPQREPKEGASDAASGIVAAMRSVTFLVFQAVPKADGLTLSATGLSTSADTRDNLEDTLRGILAIWRLASQEKSPELVPVLRTFRVEKNREGVTVSGTLPGAVLKAMAEKKKGHADQK
jgi:hypothetical protein